MLGVAILIVAGAITAGFIVKNARAEKRLADARTQGLTYFAAEEYELALPPLAQAVSRIKDDAELLHAYAKSRSEVPLPNRAHITRAINAAKIALEISPGREETQNLLLGLYARAGWLTELVELSDEAIRTNPNNRDAWIDRIEALRLLGRDAEAFRTAERFVAALPDDLISHTKWAEIAFRNGLEDEAIAAHARDITSRFESSPEFFQWLSVVERQAGNLPAAVNAARRAASLPPTSAEQLTRLVDWLNALDPLVALPDNATDDGAPTLRDLAQTIFDRGLNDPDLGQAVAAQAAKRAYWANNTKQAIEYASLISPGEGGLEAWWAGLVLIGERPTAGFGLESDEVQPFAIAARETEWAPLFDAMDALRRGEPAAVLPALDGYQPDSSDARALASYLRGVALQRMGDYRGAALALREAAENRGVARDRAWRALGDVYTFLGRFEDAEQAYSAMSDRTSSRLADYDNVLSGATRSGDVLLIRQILGILENEPEDAKNTPSVMVRLARARLLVGDIEGGTALAEQVVGRTPPPDPLGVVYLVKALDTYAPDVGQELLAGLTEQTDTIELLASRAAILARSGKLDEGRALLEAEIASREPAAALPYRRALLRVIDDAAPEQSLEEARRLSDDYPEAPAAQLSALQSRGIWNDLAAARTAVTRLREAIGEGSPAWRTYHARAVLAGDPTDEQINELIIDDLATVLRESPDDFDALVLTARAFRMIADRRREAGDAADAAEVVNRAATYYRRATGSGVRAVAFPPLIEMLREYGRPQDASREMDRFVAIIDLDDETRLRRRNLLLQTGRWSDAANDQWELAGFETPRSVLDLAVMLTRAGRYTETAEVLEMYLDHQDWPASDLEACADLFADAGYTDRAIEIYESIDEAEIGKSHEQMIVNTLSRVGEPRRALEYQLPKARRSGSVGDWMTAIRLAGSLGEAEAGPVIDEALSALPDAPEIRAFAEQDELRIRSLGVASSIPADATGPEALLRAASLSHGRGEISNEAYLQSLAQLTSEEPGYWTAWRTLARAYSILENPEGVLRTSRAAVEALPDSPLARQQLTSVLREQGQLEAAREEARTLIELTAPDTFQAEVILALIEVDLGAYEQVVNLLSGHRARLEAGSIESPEVGLTALAIAYAGLGNTTESFLLFGDRLESGQLGWQNTALLAALALPVSEIDTARSWLNAITAPELARERAEGFVRLARYSGPGPDANAALALVDEFAEPDNQTWMWIEARAAAIQGQHDRAEQLLRELITQDPEATAPLAALVDLLADQPNRADDAEEAIRQLRSALFEQDQNTSLIQLAARAEARIHLASNKPDLAISALRPLAENPDADLESRVLLAKAHLESGNLNEASKILDEARTTGIPDARSKALIRELEAALSP